MRIGSVVLGNKIIGHNSPTFIIAEAGINHNGDSTIAKKMIQAAAKCRADAIKFQTFSADKIVDSKEKSYEIFKNLEFDADTWYQLKNFCDEQDIIFLSSVFDEENADLMDELGIEAFKIASGDLTHFPLIEYVSMKDKPIILSTGMSTLDEIQNAVDFITRVNNQLILMHCISLYPTEMRYVNLNFLTTLQNNFDFPIGFSDHTLGISIPIAAVAMGAKVIEKHFTLDKSLSGPDQNLSLDIAEFSSMVSAIKDIEKALGNGKRKISEEELQVKAIARRSLFTSKFIQKGKELSKKNLIAKRPGTGISPVFWEKVTNLIAKENLEKGIMLKWDQLIDKNDSN